jgi:hypothetical protein
VDVLLVLLIPAALHLLLSAQFAEWLDDRWDDACELCVAFWKGCECVRYVEDVVVRDADDGYDHTSRVVLNHVLHKAVLLHVAEHCRAELDRARNAKVDLVATKAVRERSSYQDADSSGDEGAGGDGNEASSGCDEHARRERAAGLGELARYRLAQASLEDVELEIEKGLFLATSLHARRARAGSQLVVQTREMAFTCRGPDASARIGAFVQKAYGGYCSRLARAADVTCFYYTPLAVKRSGGRAGKGTGKRLGGEREEDTLPVFQRCARAPRAARRAGRRGQAARPRLPASARVCARLRVCVCAFASARLRVRVGVCLLVWLLAGRAWSGRHR